MPRTKICTAKAISTSNREVYPADLSVTYAEGADDPPGQGKKEQKITPQASFYFRASPIPGSGAGLAPHNLRTIDPLGGIAGVDDQLSIADDLIEVIVRVVGDDHNAIVLA